MNNNENEGFTQQEQKIEIINVKLNSNANNKNNTQTFKFRNPLSLFDQNPLWYYPEEMDKLNIKSEQRILLPNNIRKQSYFAILIFSEKIHMCLQSFQRKYFCQERPHQYTQSHTVLIRYIARPIRNQQFAVFGEKKEPKRKELSFSSSFQSANLHLVFKDSKYPIYYLLLQNDVNTHGFNFWFNFWIKAQKKGRYTMMVLNLSREIKMKEQNKCLVSYHPSDNYYRRIISFNCFETRFNRCDSIKNSWALQFQYQFQENEQIYIALAFPYTYSKMMKFLNTVKDNLYPIQVTVQIAARSQLGNSIPFLKISNKQNPSQKVILITARQHPSETVGSYVCEQMIKFILQNGKNNLSSYLLQRFTFIIMPMLNPDGVIHGNSRTNLQGYDLNRCWTRLSQIQSKQCQKVWEFIESITKTVGKIQWSLDLHGHSREFGFFAYFGQKNERSLIFNDILSTKTSLFQKEKSVFEVDYSKRQSIRGQLSQRLRVANAITIQTSMWGYKDQQGKFKHFESNHFEIIGNIILEGILQTQLKISSIRSFDQAFLIDDLNKTKAAKDPPKDEGLNQILDSDSNPQEDYLLNSERLQVQCQTINFDKLPVSINKNRNTLTQFKMSRNKNRELNCISRENKRNQSFQRACDDSQSKKQLFSNSMIKLQNKQKKCNSTSSNHNFLNIRSKIIIPSTKNIKSGNQESEFRTTQKQSIKQTFPTSFPRNIRTKSQCSSNDLNKSMQMRRRMKIAFQKSSVPKKKSREQRHLQLKSILYPTVINRNYDKRDFIREKRVRMKEIRLNEYGVTVIRQFNQSLYLRNRMRE